MGGVREKRRKRERRKSKHRSMLWRMVDGSAKTALSPSNELVSSESNDARLKRHMHSRCLSREKSNLSTHRARRASCSRQRRHGQSPPPKRTSLSSTWTPAPPPPTFRCRPRRARVRRASRGLGGAFLTEGLFGEKNEKKETRGVPLFFFFAKKNCELIIFFALFFFPRGGRNPKTLKREEGASACVSPLAL